MGSSHGGRGQATAAKVLSVDMEVRVKMDLRDVAQAVVNLDGWLETMRSPTGYGGPVAHWWQNCLQFTGAGLDWRYEGIIIGYLNLFEKTGDERWMIKARRAGDEVVRGQYPSGNFHNSCFELNPYTGGTPHEAACDLGLLHLAKALRERNDSAWQMYLDTARRNIRGYFIERLWDAEARFFKDNIRTPFFVPNKSATLVEALLAFARLTGDDSMAEFYALPVLERVLAHQVRGGSLDGAIYQYSKNGRYVTKFFPYYVARCVGGLVAGFDWWRDERYLDAACRAMSFVVRCRQEDGTIPQVVYAGMRVNRFPKWIAATGDILRAIAYLKPYGFDAEVQPHLEGLLRGQSPMGGFPTAHGFASQITQRSPQSIPELRDLLPVVGWNDKAFRYLTLEMPENQQLPSVSAEAYEAECESRGLRGIWKETDTEMLFEAGGRIAYQWQKGLPYASVCATEVLWK